MTHHLQGAWMNDAPVPPGCREKGIRTCGAKCLSPRALALKERGSLSLAALGGDSSGDMGSNAEPTGWAGWILGAEPGALGAGWSLLRSATQPSTMCSWNQGHGGFLD